MSTDRLDLSIIIVSWNVWDLLRSCLTSIERLSRPTAEQAVRHFGLIDTPATLEVIVVDNASSDATVDGLQARFPWVRVLANAENVGFTQGNNQGYAISRGDAVFFLNPDTELSNTPYDSLWLLWQTLHDEPEVGMVGPQLRYGDGSWQSSRRRFPTRFTGFFESTWLSQLWPRNPWAVRYHFLDWPATIRHDVDWLVGAAICCRRAALESIRTQGDPGPFDQGFFMYSEELDLGWRIKQAGWRIVYLPSALVIHYEGRSSEQVVTARHIHFNTSKVRYYGKVFGRSWAELLRRYLQLEYWLQLRIEQCKGWLGHKPALRQQRVAAYRAVIRHGFQPATQESPEIF